MNCELGQPVLDLNEKPRQASKYWPSLIRAILIVSGATVLIVAIFLSVGHTRLSETGRQFFGAFVYSIFIALPSIYLVTGVSIRYTARFPRLVVLMQAAVLLFTSLAGCLAAGLAFQFIGSIPRSSYWNEFWSSAPFSVVITLAIGLSMATFETLRFKLQTATLELRTRQMEQERANKLLVEARLSSLESRIHPHFLFNTLNSIASLIPSDPKRAEETVSKLASLLRFSLNANHSSLVPLAQELKVVRDYLEIESTRFGPRLSYQIAVPESLGTLKVPPLALQTLVENSVKHVVAERSEGAMIQIIGTAQAGQLQLEVIDDGPGFSLAAISPEHGLGNLSARLQLLFDNRGQLDVTRANDKNVARISFPAES